MRQIDALQIRLVVDLVVRDQLHERRLCAWRLRRLALDFEPWHQPTGLRTLRLLHDRGERFVLSIKSECLSKLVPLGERHLRNAITEFVDHYHLELNHQGLDNGLITNPAPPANDNSPVERRERIGGLLNFYFRRAS